MVAEAEQYAEEDKANKERIEGRNSLENYAYGLKNQISDESETGLGGKLDDEDKETLNEAVKEALDWLESNAASAGVEEFEEAREKLSNVAYPITSKLYGAGSPGFGAGGPEEEEDKTDGGHDEL